MLAQCQSIKFSAQFSIRPYAVLSRSGAVAQFGIPKVIVRMPHFPGGPNSCGATGGSDRPRSAGCIEMMRQFIAANLQLERGYRSLERVRASDWTAD